MQYFLFQGDPLDYEDNSNNSEQNGSAENVSSTPSNNEFIDLQDIESCMQGLEELEKAFQFTFETAKR